MARLALFTAMMKEEWRVHSTVFGHLGFALVPFILIFFSALATFLLPELSRLVGTDALIAACHLGFAFMGMTIGAFGLFGREAMNRRFGQASMVAYASRTLPVSPRTIMANFFVKETVYYFFFWVLPPVAGFALSSLALGIPLIKAGILLISLTISFLLGIASVFFLSTVYAHSMRGLVLLLTLLAAATYAALQTAAIPIEALFPPLAFYAEPSPAPFLATVLAAALLTVSAIWFVKMDFPENVRVFPNSLITLRKFFSWMEFPHFTAKDLLDLKRSEGGVGKIIFSFAFPIVIIWLLLRTLLLILPGLSATIVFALLLAAFSTTIYNWLTEYDSFSAYAFLPVSVSGIIRAKLQSYAMLNMIPIAVLVTAAVAFGQKEQILFALIAFVSLNAYAVGVLVWVAGLQPNILLYNTGTLLRFIGLIAPVMLVLIFLSLPYPQAMAGAILLLLPAWMLVKKGGDTWDKKGFQTY